MYVKRAAFQGCHKNISTPCAPFSKQLERLYINYTLYRGLQKGMLYVPDTANARRQVSNAELTARRYTGRFISMLDSAKMLFFLQKLIKSHYYVNGTVWQHWKL